MKPTREAHSVVSRVGDEKHTLKFTDAQKGAHGPCDGDSPESPKNMSGQKQTGSLNGKSKIHCYLWLSTQIKKHEMISFSLPLCLSYLRKVERLNKKERGAWVRYGVCQVLRKTQYG